MLSIFNTKHISWTDQGQTSLNYYELFMDSIDDLPTDLYMFSNESGSYKISQGSLAYDISAAEMYMMETNGTWVKQE